MFISLIQIVAMGTLHPFSFGQTPNLTVLDDILFCRMYGMNQNSTYASLTLIKSRLLYLQNPNLIGKKKTLPRSPFGPVILEDSLP
jgi:hypothetical protein